MEAKDGDKEEGDDSKDNPKAQSLNELVRARRHKGKKNMLRAFVRALVLRIRTDIYKQVCMRSARSPCLHDQLKTLLGNNNYDEVSVRIITESILKKRGEGDSARHFEGLQNIHC
jgi:hypothetical protein